jgi:hypothetical protein
VAAPAQSPLKLLALAAGALLLGYVGAGIYLAGLDTPAAPPINSNSVIFKPGQAIGERVGCRSWIADYDHIVTSADQTVVDVDNVRHGLIYKQCKPYLTVQAKHMTINTLTHDFSASGDIHIETAASDMLHKTFETDAATWSDQGQRLALPHKSTIESGMDLPLTVGSLTFDVRSGQLEINNVAGAVRFK